MRGVAAIAVLLHHAGPDLGRLPLMPSGYLAVDFFFMLSGFVLARTYEARFAAGLGPRAFLGLRLRRLWPLIAIGIVMSAAVAFGSGMPIGIVVALVLMQFAFVPLIQGELGIYHLNDIQWSLLFELIANASHAMFYRLSVGALAFAVALALVALGFVAFHFGEVGVGDTGTNVLGGFPRVLFSYGVGVLIFRLRLAGSLHRVRLPALLTIVALPLSFAGAAAAKEMAPAWLVDMLVVSTLFPLLLIAGANGVLADRLEASARLLGSLSYSLYATHVPVIWAMLLLGLPKGASTLAIATAIALALAYLLALRFEPRTPGLFTRSRTIEPLRT